MARPGKKDGLRYVEPHLGPDGKLRHYFRIGKGTRTPMPPVDGDPKLDPAFMAAYAILLNEAAGKSLPAHALPKPTGARPVVMRVATDSFGAALSRYYRHSTFAKLAQDTQYGHRGALNRFAKKFGTAPMNGLDHEVIQEAIRPLEPWPQQHLVTALRRFVRWARATGELDMKAPDPTLGLALHEVPKIKGHKAWTDAQRAQFERRWPVGTTERLAYEILNRLGLRRADVRRLGPVHVLGGMLRFQPRKTANTTAVWIEQPEFDPDLARIIAATTVVGAKTFLVDRSGKPFAKSTFAAFMRRAYAAAGLPPECRNHGLRKSMMLDLVEAGAAPHEIMAMSSHSTLKEIEGYTRAFDRRQATMRAMEKRNLRRLEQAANANSPNSPTRLGKVAKNARKSKAGRP